MFLRGPNGEIYPTREELVTLRRVRGQIGWLIYTIAFCELCERFAWYGTTQVFVNFIAEPLPPGSATGAGGTHEQAGAYGMGQQASTGITLFNNFWAYIMPLLGGYMSDTYWGKYKTINVAMLVARDPSKGAANADLCLTAGSPPWVTSSSSSRPYRASSPPRTTPQWLLSSWA